MTRPIPDMEMINEYESLCHRCGALEYVYGFPHTEANCLARKPKRVRNPKVPAC